jgi:heparan-alpha-glucosaminide N-acetyltransferase
MSTDKIPQPDDFAETPAVPPSRISSVDTYRGAVMFLMMAEVLQLEKVAESFPDSPIWKFLAHHQSHVAWTGCSVHDMIQPSFSFLVGVALPFSLASRLRRGESLRWATLHAAWRAFVLIALGIFLRSMGRGVKMTNFTFEDTLTQIGLGYFPLFLIALAKPRVRWIALVVILVGYWAAFAAYPLPKADFDYPSVGVKADWPHHATGLAAHWNKNSNLAWAFDDWFLNRFPRESGFTHNRGGYATLSFIPTLGTMILGLIAGGWLQGQGSSRGKLGRLVLAGVVCGALGWALGYFGICPIVKRIWTPSWVLFSGGIAFGVLAFLYALIDLTGYTGWTYPLRVIGRNSIASYVMAHLFEDFIVRAFQTHLGQDVFEKWGGPYEPLVAGAAVLVVYWLILFWMDRRKIYLKV